jgi:hypothetical protein
MAHFYPSKARFLKVVLCTLGLLVQSTLGTSVSINACGTTLDLSLDNVTAVDQVVQDMCHISSLQQTSLRQPRDYAQTVSRFSPRILSPLWRRDTCVCPGSTSGSTVTCGGCTDICCAGDCWLAGTVCCGSYACNANELCCGGECCIVGAVCNSGTCGNPVYVQVRLNNVHAIAISFALQINLVLT